MKWDHWSLTSKQSIRTFVSIGIAFLSIFMSFGCSSTETTYQEFYNNCSNIIKHVRSVDHLLYDLESSNQYLSELFQKKSDGEVEAITNADRRNLLKSVIVYRVLQDCLISNQNNPSFKVVASNDGTDKEIAFIETSSEYEVSFDQISAAIELVRRLYSENYAYVTDSAKRSCEAASSAKWQNNLSIYFSDTVSIESEIISYINSVADQSLLDYTGVVKAYDFKGLVHKIISDYPRSEKYSAARDGLNLYYRNLESGIHIFSYSTDEASNELDFSDGALIEHYVKNLPLEINQNYFFPREIEGLKMHVFGPQNSPSSRVFDSNGEYLSSITSSQYEASRLLEETLAFGTNIYGVLYEVNGFIDKVFCFVPKFNDQIYKPGIYECIQRGMGFTGNLAGEEYDILNRKSSFIHNFYIGDIHPIFLESDYSDEFFDCLTKIYRKGN